MAAFVFALPAWWVGWSLCSCYWGRGWACCVGVGRGEGGGLLGSVAFGILSGIYDGAPL